MKKNIPYSLILLLSALLLTFVVAAMRPQKPASKTGPKTTGYDAGWKTADSLAKKGLYKSANETALELYQKARTDGNMPQLVKAALYRSRFQSMEGSDGLL